MKSNTGKLAILILGLILAVRLGGNLVKLYKAGGRLTGEEQKLAEMKEENRQLKERLEEVKTPEYLEREAREKLGMGKEGEMVVIIPREERVETDEKLQDLKEEEPNWVKWRKLYLGW